MPVVRVERPHVLVAGCAVQALGPSPAGEDGQAREAEARADSPWPNAWCTLRTGYSSARTAAGVDALAVGAQPRAGCVAGARRASNAVSAASMPVFIAR